MATTCCSPFLGSVEGAPPATRTVPVEHTPHDSTLVDTPDEPQLDCSLDQVRYQSERLRRRRALRDDEIPTELLMVAGMWVGR